MYIHQHWPFNRPYAARTWTMEDWRGYVGGLRKLGYNTIQIWPMLETMPQPLTPSDKNNLAKIAKVIDMAHDLDMRVYLVISANVIPNDALAEQATFEERHFFHCNLRVNPADKKAIQRMMARRKELFRPLAKTDGVSIIDSDPGGYPGSTNEEFISLLGEHRKMLDNLRPGIELIYWLHVSWPAYSEYYQTNRFRWGKIQEYEQHGYENYWGFRTWGSWPELSEALDKINDPLINQVLEPKMHAKTPFGQVKEEFYHWETFTPQLIQAMRSVWRRM